MFNKMRAQVEQEKAALVLENAKQAAKAERELNGTKKRIAALFYFRVKVSSYLALSLTDIFDLIP